MIFYIKQISWTNIACNISHKTVFIIIFFILFCILYKKISWKRNLANDILHEPDYFFIILTCDILFCIKKFSSTHFSCNALYKADVFIKLTCDTLLYIKKISSKNLTSDTLFYIIFIIRRFSNLKSVLHNLLNLFTWLSRKSYTPLLVGFWIKFRWKKWLHMFWYIFAKIS